MAFEFAAAGLEKIGNAPSAIGPQVFKIQRTLFESEKLPVPLSVCVATDSASSILDSEF